MPRIKFVREYIVKDADRTKYTEGQVVELNEASCLHFESRGAAVRVSDAPAPAPQARPQEAPAPDVPPFRGGGPGLLELLKTELAFRTAETAAKQLTKVGILTVEDFLEADEDALIAVYGINAKNLPALLEKARG